MKTIFALVLLTSSLAFGKYNKPVTAAEPLRDGPTTLGNADWSGLNALYLKVTPYQSGVGLGLNYERSWKKNLGFGGAFNFLPEKDSGSHPAPGLMAFTGNFYLHFPVEFIDFYISPGLGVFFMEFGPDDDIAPGASLAIGSLAQLSSNLAVGIEFSVYRPWFNKDFYVAASDYYTNFALTGRLSF